MNTESNARQAGWQTNSFPPNGEAVLIRIEAPGYAPLLLGYWDVKEWRYPEDGTPIRGQIIGWIRLEDAAFYLDLVGNLSDS